MREEWNKGYEKGRDDYCCNGNCNQGRDCLLRKKELTDEEIHDLMDEIRQAVGDDIERAMYRMARAILRKAQNG